MDQMKQGWLIRRLHCPDFVFLSIALENYFAQMHRRIDA